MPALDYNGDGDRDGIGKEYKSIGEGVLIKKECESEEEDNYSSSQSAKRAADTESESESEEAEVKNEPTEEQVLACIEALEYGPGHGADFDDDPAEWGLSDVRPGWE